jgi:D-alanyl-D-alanine dipeptidase
MKPYQQISIVECGEPLVPIPLDRFALEEPHPYVKRGAPYGNKSPYYLRHTVLNSLLQAQSLLQQNFPGWKILVFDAYRPIAVQQYMVDCTFAQTLAERALSLENLTLEQQQTIWEEVYQFWAVPSLDPAMPPPHSTGAAIDVTLVDETGMPVAMGSAIDEMSPRSYPDHFADKTAWMQDKTLTQADADRFHAHRQQLKQVMTAAGFRQHHREWWHFSQGDQVWAWLMQQSEPDKNWTARYGKA